ncbi:MAG: copper homeostasis protein CutC [Lachnospiraceae bacterium]|nr:copper homeostasis protein CutC [Lachnospiraceae bacterium]
MKDSPYILECCADSVASAIMAQKGGAKRLELCANLIIGGTTPSPALFAQVRKAVSLPIHILIRPRFGDFLYSQAELAQMEMEIQTFCQAGADGVVIGCLQPDGSLDSQALQKLIQQAGSMHLTLHRAFDMCRDPFQSLEDAIRLGFHTILTSGCQNNCLQGIPLLKELFTQADSRLSLMAGAGVDESVVRTLLAETSLTAFHMSGKRVKESGMQYRNPQVAMGVAGISEYELLETDAEAVAAVSRLLYSNI